MPYTLFSNRKTRRNDNEDAAAADIVEVDCCNRSFHLLSLALD